MDAFVLERTALDVLVDTLRDRGYRVVGPTVRDGAIVHAELRSAADLPAGWTEDQEGGTYRLRRREDEACFGYAAGPHSWKQELLPPDLVLWRAERRNGDFRVTSTETEPGPVAFLGVRSCDLHAIAIQDRVLAGGAFADADYAARRRRILVVAVNCGEAGGTCFCDSMGTGPRAESGFDLALTELLDGEHRFLVEVGSEDGRGVLADVPHRDADEEDLRAAAATTERARAGMGRTLDTTGIRDLLVGNLEHPRWDEVAERCLTCGNCTMVCPTCFCTSVEDVSDLSGERAERRRSWDSCFSLAYSYAGAGSVRPSPRARYRQWLTHKLGTWHDQFGTSGCVGCGRCITWCPVAIDITEEVAAIRATQEEENANA